MLTFNVWDMICGILGFLGTCIVFWYGVPNMTDTGGKVSIVLEQENEIEKLQIRKYKIWSQVGLAMIAIYFLLQLLANIKINEIRISTIITTNIATLLELCQSK